MNTIHTQKGVAIPLIIAGILVVIIGGYMVFNNQSATPNAGDSMMEEESREGDVVTGEDSNMEDDSMMEGDTAMEDDAMMEGESTVKGVGLYSDYKPELIANAEEGKVVLFFGASWCPGCRALDADIKENKDSIPEGVTILKLDYDTETELKKKYGVTTQHTLVQVDAEGNMIGKTAGDSSLEKLLGGLK